MNGRIDGHTDTHDFYTDIWFKGMQYRCYGIHHHKKAIKKLDELKDAAKKKEVKH